GSATARLPCWQPRPPSCPHNHSEAEQQAKNAITTNFATPWNSNFHICLRVSQVLEGSAKGLQPFGGRACSNLPGPDRVAADHGTGPEAQHTERTRSCAAAGSPGAPRRAFMKYLHRSGGQHAGSVEALVVSDQDQLTQAESQVLESWTQRKRVIDLCQQYVTFESSAQQLLSLLTPCSSSPAVPPDTAQKVEILYGIATSFARNGHPHCAQIRQLVAQFDRYVPIDKARRQLLGLETPAEQKQPQQQQDSSTRASSGLGSVSSVTSGASGSASSGISSLDSKAEQRQLAGDKKRRYILNDFLPEDTGHCFVSFGKQLAAALYVEYCVNKTDSAELLSSRRSLLDNCELASTSEIQEGLDAMIAVPKKANDALHLSMLDGLPDDFGDVLLHDSFVGLGAAAADSEGPRPRHVFLFDLFIVFAKEVARLGHAAAAAARRSGGGYVSGTKTRYQFKQKFALSNCSITEQVGDSDPCKFGMWPAGAPIRDEYRLILKANCLDDKQQWPGELTVSAGQLCELIELLPGEIASVGLLSDNNSEGQLPARNSAHRRRNSKQQSPPPQQAAAHLLPPKTCQLWANEGEETETDLGQAIVEGRCLPGRSNRRGRRGSKETRKLRMTKAETECDDSECESPPERAGAGGDGPGGAGAAAAVGPVRLARHLRRHLRASRTAAAAATAEPQLAEQRTETRPAPAAAAQVPPSQPIPVVGGVRIRIIQHNLAGPLLITAATCAVGGNGDDAGSVSTRQRRELQRRQHADLRTGGIGSRRRATSTKLQFVLPGTIITVEGMKLQRLTSCRARRLICKERNGRLVWGNWLPAVWMGHRGSCLAQGPAGWWRPAGLDKRGGCVHSQKGAPPHQLVLQSTARTIASAQHIACEQHKDYFEQVRLALRDDKEDMNSHLMNPVQRCMPGPAAACTGLCTPARAAPCKTESIIGGIESIDSSASGYSPRNRPGARCACKAVLNVVPHLPGTPVQHPAVISPLFSQLKFEQRKRVSVSTQMMLVTEPKATGNNGTPLLQQRASRHSISCNWRQPPQPALAEQSTVQRGKVKGGLSQAALQRIRLAAAATEVGAGVIDGFDIYCMTAAAALRLGTSNSKLCARFKARSSNSATASSSRNASFNPGDSSSTLNNNVGLYNNSLPAAAAPPTPPPRPPQPQLNDYQLDGPDDSSLSQR
uniref:BRCT domain-containing protein n=1 Tax=Macrostomum lignano TaxID=282301 RepID=A0A1I8FGY6_9PLAT